VSPSSAGGKLAEEGETGVDVPALSDAGEEEAALQLRTSGIGHREERREFVAPPVREGQAALLEPSAPGGLRDPGRGPADGGAPPFKSGPPGSAIARSGVNLSLHVCAKYRPRSWTHPSQSASVIRFGVVKTGWFGSSRVTFAVSSVMRSCGRAISNGYGA